MADQLQGNSLTAAQNDESHEMLLAFTLPGNLLVCNFLHAVQ